MKKLIICVVIILVIAAIVIFAVLFNDRSNTKANNKTELDYNEENVRWLQTPSAYVNNRLYFGKGEVLHSVPDGWEYYGTIVKNVERVELTPEEELNSNVAKIGAKVFLNKSNLDKIYIEFIIEGKIQYNEFRVGKRD